MLFGHLSVKEASTFKALLNLFSEASTTSINASESQLFFFHTPTLTQRNITKILGFLIAVLPSKYLGAPMLDSAIKHASSRTLIDKLETRLSSWTFRLVNIVGRLITIKSVLQAMPLYVFSILASPKWVLKNFHKLQRNFLWGSAGLNRKWALVKWTEVCLPRSAGGLGLRDPLHSNNTMGARVWWNCISKPHIPWAHIWQDKYALGSQWGDLIRINTTTPGSLIGMPQRNIVPLFKRIVFGRSFRALQLDSGRTLGNKFPNLPLSSTNPTGKLLCRNLIKSMYISFGSSNPLKIFNSGDQPVPGRLIGRGKHMKRSIGS